MSHNFSSLMHHILPEQVVSLLQEMVARNPELLKGQRDGVAALFQLAIDSEPYPIHFFYVVDPHDILSYCYPFGFRYQKEISGGDLDILSDSQTGWEKFFSQVPFLLLLDEHRNEFARNRNRLARDLKSQIDEFREFENLVKKIYGQYELTREKIDELKNEIFVKRLRWLVSAGTGELQKAPERFRSIISKLFITAIVQDNFRLAAPWLSPDVQEVHHDAIMRVLNNTSFSPGAFRRYNHHIEKYEEKEVTLDDLRQDNLLTDHKVTDRILLLNAELEAIRHELKCRYFILYLSSDRKSKQISRELEPDLPVIHSQPFNIMRNVSQLWLLNLFSGNEQDFEESMVSPAMLQSLLFAYNAVRYGSAHRDPAINRKITELRERMEWHGLLKNITLYPDKLKRAFRELESKASFEPLRQALAELQERLKSTSAESALQSFLQEIRTYSIQTTAFQTIISVLTPQTNPVIEVKGYVVGINHHLPTLFTREEPLSRYQQHIDKIVDFILSPVEEPGYDEEFRSLAAQVSHLLLSDDLGDVQDIYLENNWEMEIQHYERQTMLYLFALLLPPKRKASSVNNNSDHSDSGLDELLLFDIESICERLEHLEPADTMRSARLKNIVSNLYYIEIWSLRRNSKLSECAEVLDAAAEFHFANCGNAADIRILHGKALLSYSRLSKFMEAENVKPVGFLRSDDALRRYWREAQREVAEAVNAYENNNTQAFSPQIYEKAYSALLNTQLYLYVLGFALTGELFHQGKARELLDRKLSRFEHDRRNNPEYLHSESALEYLEAQAFYETDKELSYKKILAARKAIENCVEKDRQMFPNKKPDNDYLELQAAIENFFETKFPADRQGVGAAAI